MNLDIHVVLPSGREVLAGSVDDTGGIIAFEYARSYISDTEAYPLAPSLRLGRGEYIPASGRDMVPGLADAQPDSWGRRALDLVPSIAGVGTPDSRGAPQPRDSAGRFGRKRNSPPENSL